MKKTITSPLEAIIKIEEIHKNYPQREAYPEVLKIMLATEENLLHYLKGKITPKTYQYYEEKYRDHKKKYEVFV